MHFYISIGTSLNRSCLVLPILLFIVSSCGIPLRMESNPSDTYAETSTGEAIPMTHDTRECSDDLSEKHTMVSHYIGDGQFSNVELKRKFLNESLLIQSEKDLEGLFTSFFAGGHFDRISVYNQKTGVLNSSVATKKRATVPVLCKGQLYNERNTYESATAMVLHSLDIVQEKVKEIKELSSLKAIDVFIGPKVITTAISKYGKSKHTEKKELINNAYYDFSEGQIVFLQQGFNKQGQIPFGRVPLWQIPFVPAHEYGHHVFSSLLTKYYGTGKFKNKKKVCFDNSEGAHAHRASRSVRMISKSLSIDSLNEGFADLFAQYTLGDGYTLGRVGCLSKSRDVKSNDFLSGEIKTLSKERLSDFYNSKTLEKNYSCFDKTNNQDVHIIGAIIAYGFDSLMNIVSYSDKDKLTMITRWIKTLNENFIIDFKETTAINILDRHITRFYKLLLSENIKLEKEIKESFIATFPEINIK